MLIFSLQISLLFDLSWCFYAHEAPSSWFVTRKLGGVRLGSPSPLWCRGTADPASDSPSGIPTGVPDLVQGGEGSSAAD